jgi:integrase
MLKERNTRKGFIEHATYLDLLKALPGYLRPFVAFAYLTGWRRSEISSLTWAQVDRVQGVVRLEPGTTKNDEARTLYLDEELQALFSDLWKARKHKQNVLPWVFVNESGDGQVGDFRFSWSKACNEIGMSNLLFHDLRRSAIRNMVRAGIPERVAMMISGHKTRSVFDRYNIVSDADLKLAAERQQTYLKSQTGTISGTIHKIGTKKGTTLNG